MLNNLKPKSEFTRNVLTLMTGTTIAQAIPIAISPILTRLYTPEDFGVLALFVAITSILGSIACGKYELAIMLPKKDEDAINIFALGFIIVSLLTLIAFLLIFLFHDKIVDLLNNESIGIWLYFIPISLLFTGAYNLLTYFNNRKKYYKDIAHATIMKSIVIAVIQLSVGLLKGGVSGLISGQLISQMFANMKLLKNIIVDKILLSAIKKVKIVVLAKKYKNFPKFMLWAGLANTSSTHITNILISSLFSITTLGYYSLGQRILGVPSALIGNSIGQVYFQEASKEKQLTNKAINIFTSTIKKLIFIGLLFFGIVFFIIEDVFVFAFGEEWEIAGMYAKILIPLFLINFISSPLAQIMSVFEKQKSGLIINIILLLSSVILILVLNNLNFSFINFLYIYTYTLSFNYFLFIFYYYKLAKGD